MDWLLQGETWREAGSVLVRLAVGVVLAALVGIERELSGRPAGIRTHMLVALGAMLFSEAGRAFGGDPGRIASQVVTGIGFLGAGTIMRTGGEIKGLTTAASVWATAAIAMMVSAGGPFIIVAVVATVVALVTLAVMDNFERRFFQRNQRKQLRLTVSTVGCLPAVLEYLETQDILVVSTEVIRDGGESEFLIEVEPAHARLLAIPSVVDDVKAARWSV